MTETPTRVPLTKRETFALELFVAALTSGRDTTPDEFADTAVARADALIARLHKPAPDPVTT